VYSVNTEEEAKALLTVACQTNINGEFLARELISDQTIENLWAFGDRLEKVDEMMKKRRKQKVKA